jgi:hypothetical protein
MGYEGYCSRCVKCNVCKGDGTEQDPSQGRISCRRCRGVGGFPCPEHD